MSSRSDVQIDAYQVLGVSKDASQAEIKRAYHRLSRELHPDKGGDTSKMALANQANDILSDPERRRKYDLSKSSSNSSRSHFEMDENDLFAHMFNDFFFRANGFGPESFRAHSGYRYDEGEDDDGGYYDEGDDEDEFDEDEDDYDDDLYDEEEEEDEDFDLNEVLSDIGEHCSDKDFLEEFRDNVGVDARMAKTFKLPGAPRNLSIHRHHEGKWCLDWYHAVDDPRSEFPIAYRLEVKQNGGSWTKLWSGTDPFYSIGLPFHASVDFRVRTVSVAGFSSYVTFQRLIGEQTHSTAGTSGSSQNERPKAQPTPPQPKPPPAPPAPKAFKIHSVVLDEQSNSIKPKYHTELTFTWEMPKTNVKINKYYIQMRKSVKGETWETCCTVLGANGKAVVVLEDVWGDYEFTIKCESDTKVMSQTSTATPHHIYCPLLRPFLTTYQTLKKDTTTPLPTHLRTLQSQAAKLSTVVTFTDSEQSGKKLLTKLLDEEVKHTLEKWETKLQHLSSLLFKTGGGVESVPCSWIMGREWKECEIGLTKFHSFLGHLGGSEGSLEKRTGEVLKRVVRGMVDRACLEMRVGPFNVDRKLAFRVDGGGVEYRGDVSVVGWNAFLAVYALVGVIGKRGCEWEGEWDGVVEFWKDTCGIAVSGLRAEILGRVEVEVRDSEKSERGKVVDEDRRRKEQEKMAAAEARKAAEAAEAEAQRIAAGEALQRKAEEERLKRLREAEIKRQADEEKAKVAAQIAAKKAAEAEVLKRKTEEEAAKKKAHAKELAEQRKRQQEEERFKAAEAAKKAEAERLALKTKMEQEEKAKEAERIRRAEELERKRVDSQVQSPPMQQQQPINARKVGVAVSSSTSVRQKDPATIFKEIKRELSWYGNTRETRLKTFQNLCKSCQLDEHKTCLPSTILANSAILDFETKMGNMMESLFEISGTHPLLGVEATVEAISEILEEVQQVKRETIVRLGGDPDKHIPEVVEKPSVGSSTVNASSPSEAQAASPINTVPVLNQDTKAKGKKSSPASKAQDAARYDEDSERVFDFTEIQQVIGVPAPEVVPQVCSFFNSKRGCRNGDKCKHLHERIKAEAEKKVEDPEAQNFCRFFNSKRGCRNGDKCKSLHVERAEKQRASNEEMISPITAAAEPRVTKVSKDSTQMKPLAKEFVPTASNISEDHYMSGSSSSDSQYFENEDYQQDENQQQYPNHQYPGQQYQSSDEVFPSVLSPVPVYTFGSAAPDPIASLFTQTLLPPSSANASNQMFDSSSIEGSHPGFSPPSSVVGNGVGYVPASSSSFFANGNGSGNSSSTAFDFTGGMARGMGVFGSQPPLSSRLPPGLTKQPSASFLGDAYQQQQQQQSRSAMLSKSLATLNSMLDRHSMSRMQLSQRIEEGHSGEYWQHDMAEMTRLNDEIKCLEVSRILLLESLSEACRQEVMY